jgi:hypothetical protein
MSNSSTKMTADADSKGPILGGCQVNIRVLHDGIHFYYLPSSGKNSAIAKKDENGIALPGWPIERIIRTVRRLWYKDDMAVSARSFLQPRRMFGLGCSVYLESTCPRYMFKVGIVEDAESHRRELRWGKEVV